MLSLAVIVYEERLLFDVATWDALGKVSIGVIAIVGIVYIVRALVGVIRGSQGGQTTLAQVIKQQGDVNEKLLDRLDSSDDRIKALNEQNTALINGLKPILEKMSESAIKRDTQIDILSQQQKETMIGYGNLLEATNQTNVHLSSIAETNATSAAGVQATAKQLGVLNEAMTLYTKDLSDAYAEQTKHILDNLTGQFVSVNQNVNDQAQRMQEFVATIPDNVWKAQAALDMQATHTQNSVGIDEMKVALNRLREECLTTLHNVEAQLARLGQPQAGAV